MGRIHEEIGIRSAVSPSRKTIVVLSRDFPWCPSLLNTRFKLEVLVSTNSRLLLLAQDYFHRFGIEVQAAPGYQTVLQKIAASDGVVDEGWYFSTSELIQLSRVARSTPIFRVGSQYKLQSTRGDRGSPCWTAVHKELGGVTDLVSRLWKWHFSGLDSGETPVRRGGIERDLRSLLKAGKDGDKARQPLFVPPTPVGKVVWLRPNEVSSAGLYPLATKDKAPCVRTVFSGRSWVTRELTPSERLLLLDIPEPLLLLVSRQQDHLLMTRLLFESCRVPLKSLDGLLTAALADLEKLDQSEDNRESILWESEMKRDRVVATGLSTNVNLTITSGTSLFNATREEKNESQPDGSDDSWESQEMRCHNVLELVELIQSRINGGETEDRSKRSDYEGASEAIWDVRVLPSCFIGSEGNGERLNWRKAFGLLRKCMLRRWKRNVVKTAVQYLKERSDPRVLSEDVEGIRDCLRRVADATVWGWDGGSRPFFWRWPQKVLQPIRDGFPLWLRPGKVSWNEAQPMPAPRQRELMQKKIADVRMKRYVTPGNPSSLIRFFGVSKGADDIRMVYDGTKSGLNAKLWAPWFPLPTASTHLKIVEASSWMADNDAGEFFLNWMMDDNVRQLCGVDITHFLNPGEDAVQAGRKIELWTRCAMGLRPSPYVCVKGILLAKEVIMGDRRDSNNVFRYDDVVFNLPGMTPFIPNRPWVSKRRADGSIAADWVSFVDDLRLVASSDKECWEASQLVSKSMAWLGLQDAARKRNPPSQSPGPWAGIVVTTDSEKVYVSVSQKKWEKAKEIISKIREELPTGKVGFKALESYTGYLVYVAQAYPSMKPYLSGLYGTLNSWRPDRTADGYKIKKRKLGPSNFDMSVDFEIDDSWRLSFHEEGVELGDSSDVGHNVPEALEAPSIVRFMARAHRDVAALESLTVSPVPPLRVVRADKTVSLIYGFGDASGTGFGSAIQLGSGELFWRSGVWNRVVSGEAINVLENDTWTIKDEMSSNYRELRNLVDSVEIAASKGLLTGYQLMLFTDNSTAESAFHKGSSTCPDLHELVVRLRILEMTFSAELLIVHVSGKRMIESGVDGTSRGDMSSGVMAGQSIHSFIPLHRSGLERSGALLSWCETWCGRTMENLVPSRWPEVHEETGTYLWSAPPAAADAALEWMGESIHKRSSSIHIVVVPRLMTCRWRKTLGKQCDVEIVVPCGTPVWPAEMYEPLVIGISLPLLRSCSEKGTWRLKGSERICEFESSVSRVWTSDFSAAGDLLRQLLRQARKLQAL